MKYRKATLEDLEKIWNQDIKDNNEDSRYVKWKSQYIEDNVHEKCATFVVVNEEEPVGQITIIFSEECAAVRQKPFLCNGKDIANMNAFRIRKEYEGQGHISKLVKLATEYARSKKIQTLTIGCEAKEGRNMAIYFHFGYTEFLTYEIENNELILYYLKRI